MSNILKVIIKALFYILIVFTLVRWIVGLFIPWTWLVWVLGTVVALAVAYSLEKSGMTNKILAALFDPKKSVKDTIGESMSSMFDDGSATDKGLETTMKCPNCGSMVTLNNGHGKCRACDSAF